MAGPCTGRWGIALVVAFIAGAGCGERRLAVSGALADSGSTDASDVPQDSRVPAARQWIVVAAGTFIMGSPPEEPCRSVLKETQHAVTLTRSFEIARTETTQGAFERLVGYRPVAKLPVMDPYLPSWVGDDHPVLFASWHEAVAYCNALSRGAGLAQCYACDGGGTGVTCEEAQAYQQERIFDCPGYRLPTEAEWEYAYRAGMTTALHNGAITSCSGMDRGADEVAWHRQNAGGGPHPVGRKLANAWRIHDMAGNVGEWCHDAAASPHPRCDSTPVTDPWGVAGGFYRVVRGGCWDDVAGNLRAAARDAMLTGHGVIGVGFRCARTRAPGR